MAKAYSKYGRYDRAIELYQFAVKRADRNLDIAALYHGLGTAYTRMGKYDDGIPYIEKAVELAEDISAKLDYSYDLGSAYRSTNQMDKAIKAYQFIVNNPKEVLWTESARRNLFSIYRQQNVLDEYIKKYEKAIEEDPKNYTAIINLATIYSSVQYDTKKAADYYEMAYKLKPDNETVRERLAQMYENSQQFDKALDLYIRVAEAADEYRRPYAYERVCNIYLRQGNKEEASKWAQRILTLETKYYYTYTQVASIFQRLEEYDKAVEAYNMGIEAAKEPYQKESVLYQLGQFYKKRREYAKAKEVFEEILNNELQGYYNQSAQNEIRQLNQLMGAEDKEDGNNDEDGVKEKD